MTTKQNKKEICFMLKSKKVLALALAAVMVLTLAACTGNNSSSALPPAAL
jgi:hypothetical protein